jgi:arsenate reductase
MEKVLFALVALALAARRGDDQALNRPVADYVRDRSAEFDQIPSERKELLEKIASYVRDGNRANKPARLVFVCTHNSRRSQLSQVWAQAAATYYGVRVETFSGGTEATAFNPRAVAALKRAGLEISGTEPSGNPRYKVEFGSEKKAIDCFSKVFDQPPNPKTEFCAVMTCSEADEDCPTVAGAAVRVPLHYEDPKQADGTPQESAAYDERCAQIAREMLYVFSRVEQ